jgi:N-acyl-D-aspartate/D-glutamate deacylase
MLICDTLIRNARVIDGSGVEAGAEAQLLDVALLQGRILSMQPGIRAYAASIVDAAGMVLAPGFIDSHTHDDTNVIRTPQMLPKLSQGVTTVIVGNCGISASPATLRDHLPDPMNLLGPAAAFSYPDYASYIAAINRAQPAVNVGALVGHTTLRNNHMDRLDRAASPGEVAAMRQQLEEALEQGALGLSTGLAYLSAFSASTDEVVALAEALSAHEAIYTTHLRSETEAILDALQEAFLIGKTSKVPVVVSHLKCAGIANWGRSEEVLSFLEKAQEHQSISFDCYPYAAGSSTLDLRQVDERVKIMITWSEPHPEMAGLTLSEIAEQWAVPQLEAATRLRPAGAIYHSISEDDMRRILQHPATMIGSDGLPNDPLPHPRLWGTFPRVLGRYSRDEKLFSLTEAVHKMTGLTAERFHMHDRGLVKRGYCADLVLFNPDTIEDTATFAEPISAAAGIIKVWVNGVLSYREGKASGARAGHFLPNAGNRPQQIMQGETIYQ